MEFCLNKAIQSFEHIKAFRFVQIHTFFANDAVVETIFKYIHAKIFLSALH